MQVSHASARYLIALAALAACVSAEAGFTGNSFDTYYGFGDPVTLTPLAGASASPSRFTVGDGQETIFNVQDVTFVDVDFSDTTLSLRLRTDDLTNPNPTWTDNTTAPFFNGLVFNVASTGTPLGTPLLGFSVLNTDSTTMAGFDVGRVGLTANQITIDWKGLSYANGTTVVVNFVSEIPEPGTYALMALGLVVLGGAARARRNATETQGASLAQA